MSMTYVCNNAKHRLNGYPKHYKANTRDGFCPDCAYGKGVLLEMEQDPSKPTAKTAKKSKKFSISSSEVGLRRCEEKWAKWDRKTLIRMLELEEAKRGLLDAERRRKKVKQWKNKVQYCEERWMRAGRKTETWLRRLRKARQAINLERAPSKQPVIKIEDTQYWKDIIKWIG